MKEASEDTLLRRQLSDMFPLGNISQSSARHGHSQSLPRNLDTMTTQ